MLVYAALFLAVLNNLHRQESTQVISFVLIFLALALSIHVKLDPAALDRCMKDQGLVAVKNDIEVGIALKLEGTPAFLVDGQVYMGDLPAAVIEPLRPAPDAASRFGGKELLLQPAHATGLAGAEWWSWPKRWQRPCMARRSISLSSRARPARRRAACTEITMSPRKMPSPAGSASPASSCM